MLSVADAQRAVLARIGRTSSETIALVDARGRTLYGAIDAPRALPNFDNAAMDGYATRASELPATLPVVAEIAAGARDLPTIAPGAAARIYTGAPLPAELDAVVMQEDATRDSDRVTLPATAVGANIRRAGEDIAIGDRVFAPGTVLGAHALGVLAALGVTRVEVARAPRVAILATGDELVPIDAPLAPGQITASSSVYLAAAIAEAGGLAIDLGIVRDDAAAIASTITRALTYDVVITTGGVSVGDRDHVHAALVRAGVALELYKVAMKPGKPFSLGRSGTTPVFGLPGNPISTVTAFELFVRPALRAMLGERDVMRPRAIVELVGGYRKQAGRTHYLRAHVTREGTRLIATAHAKQGSAMYSSLVGCNALVEVAADAEVVAPGAPVPALLLDAV